MQNVNGENDYLDRLREPLRALMAWFTESRLRASIIGGIGASLRGKPRLTKDIDAVVLDADAETLIASSEAYGFAPRIEDAENFARTSRVLLLRYVAANIDIDISLGALPFEEDLVERSTMLDVGGIRLPVASAEDLVIMKAVAGRARDVTDIENLIVTNADLDIEYIRRWVREFSAVLDMPEIYENLEKLLRRRKR